MRNIAVLLTRFQYQLFSEICEKEEISNLIIITPKHIYESNKEYLKNGVVLTYEHLPRYLTFHNARKLIAETKSLVEEYDFDSNDKLWVANFANAFVQILFNLVKFHHVNLIEDGLGSYVHASLWRDGLISTLRKIKKCAYYFPRYNPLHTCSSGISAKEGYAYNDSAFPQQKNIVKKIFKKTIKKTSLDCPAPDSSIIFIGQPLVELRYLSSNDYVAMLKNIQQKYASQEQDFIYRPHPGEKAENIAILESQGFLVNRDSDVSVEDYVFSSGKNLIIVGFVSTALIYVKSLVNVSRVIALKTPYMKGLIPYYETLKHLGVEVVSVENCN